MKRINSINSFCIIFAIMLLIIQIYTHLSVLDFDNYFISKCNIIKMLLSVIIETAIIVTPCLFLQRFFKQYIIFSTIILLIIAITNVLYSRVFHCYFPITMANEIQNLNGLSNSIFSLITTFDLLLLIVVLGFIIYIIYYPPLPDNTNFKINVKFSILILPIIILIELFSTYGAFTYKALIPNRIIHTFRKEISSYNYDKELYLFRNGLIHTYTRDLFNLVSYQNIKLSRTEIQMINNSIQRKYTETNQKIENCIFIIVESLMSFPIDLQIDGIEITPNLNKLKKIGYYNDNMISQIEKGMSSDGQFIYFTGLLPHKGKTTIVDYTHNKYYGLGEYAQQKGMNTVMIVPTTKTFWNQDKACELYGINRLWGKEDYHCVDENSHIKEWLNDEQIFNFSRWICEHELNPFFLTILTVSMHMPYYDKFEYKRINIDNPNYSNEYINYLQKINYTDYHIGLFVDYLKKNGLFEKTAIVIASDHKIPIQFKEAKSDCIPLFLINCDKPFSKRMIGQADLYPTILDIFNISDTSWRGIGYSLYTCDTINVLNSHHQSKISKLIIESDYFSTYN